jgi:hypothetical protein
VGAGEAVNAEIGDLLISVCPSWSFALAALVREVRRGAGTGIARFVAAALDLTVIVTFILTFGVGSGARHVR